MRGGKGYPIQTKEWTAAFEGRRGVAHVTLASQTKSRLAFDLPMKSFLIFAGLALGVAISLAAIDTSKSPAAINLVSGLYNWEKMVVTPTPNGVRRAVFDGATPTVDKLHCHITTLNPGEKSSEPRRHLQDEVIIVKEGTIEANWDGNLSTGGPGSVIFFAAGATTALRNAGQTPATYIVVNYYTPLTPKS